MPPLTSAPAQTEAATGTAYPFDLDGFLPYRIAVAAAAVSTGLATVYAERFDVTIPEWRILANLGRHGTLTAGDLANRSSLDKVQVARAVKRLVARKFVRRRVDRADRRRAFLSLTTAGERMRTDIAALALDWERHLLDTLSPEAREALAHGLAVIATRALALKPPA